MIVAVIEWELEIYGCQSLKEKRRVVRSLKDRLRNRLNVSVAETAHQDVWQRAELGAAVVSTSRRHADSVLEKADTIVRGEHRARVIASHRDFV